jgi:Fe-S-cluster-containing hydrogenase component 2
VDTQEVTLQMAKMLLISPEKCTGCHSCELGCSLAKEERFIPALSRVSVFTWEREGISVPMMCVQCEDAFCQGACPTGSITRDPLTGAMLVNDRTCIKCKMCVQACPFGGTAYDPVSAHILKCDLCGGDPECVKFCPSDALTYVDANKANTERKRAYAARLKAGYKGGF